MKKKNHTDNALKQALQQRKQGELSSNFSFQMMGQIRHAAVKQQKQRERVMLYSIIGASLSLVGLAVYLLFFKLDIGWKELLPRIEWQWVATPMLAFYIYIGVLALALLGFDYWLRRNKSVH